MRSNFWNLQRTPLPSPVFSTSSANDSGFDTVFWLLNFIFFLYTVLRMNTVTNNFKNYLRKNINWKV